MIKEPKCIQLLRCGGFYLLPGVFCLTASSPPIRTGVSAQVTTSFASGRRPPQASPATRLSRCCRDAGVVWPCLLPGTPEVKGQQLHLPRHLQTLPLWPPYPPEPLTCPPSAQSARRWVRTRSDPRSRFRLKSFVCCWITEEKNSEINFCWTNRWNSENCCVLAGQDERVCVLLCALRAAGTVRAEIYGLCLCVFQPSLEGYEIHEVPITKQDGQSLGISIIGYNPLTSQGRRWRNTDKTTHSLQQWKCKKKH